MRSLLTRAAAWAVERPLPVIVVALVVALLGAGLALRLEPNAETDTLVDSGSEAFAATEDFKQRFGDDAVVVLVEGDLRELVLTERLGTLLALESCLSGNAPDGRVFGPEREAPAACAGISRERPSKVVYGPATFLNQFALQATRLFEQRQQDVQQRAQQAAAAAAEAARRDGASEALQAQAGQAAAAQVVARYEEQVRALALEYKQFGLPSLDNVGFVSSVVFDERLGAGVPKPRFSYLFPSSQAALISVRLRPGLSDSERSEAIALYREAVADPAFAISGAEFTVSGVPAVVDGLAAELSSQTLVLLIAAMAVMALTLALVFSPPLRLAPLAVALGASAITFGLLSLGIVPGIGDSLTMASIAVLPVLIGLAVDYAIQFQARFNEAAGSGSSPARAAVEAAARGGPVIATAALATAAGFLVLLLSPIPMVRSFNLLLVLGVSIAFALALTAGLAALSLTPAAGSVGTGPPSPAGRIAARGGARVRSLSARTQAAAAGLASRRAAIGGRLSRAGRAVLANSISAPARVLAIALALAVIGWVAGTRTEVVSDIRELVPADLPALEEVDTLERATGISGEVDVTVTAADITDPAVIEWMREFEARVLAEHGPRDELASCLEEGAEVCPSISLPDLFGEAGVPAAGRIRRVLELLPTYFRQAVVSTDPETGGVGDTAVIAFGIKVMPFDEQQDLIDDIRAEINPPGSANDPPEGVEAELVGLPVLAADANAELSDSRYLLTVAGLIAVALALLAAYRSAGRALVPLIPIVLATGWSSLVAFLAGVPLNPMSATLGALVIAIATEFSVILSARYHEERGSGSSVGESLRRAYARTGAAVAASGVTAIAGFAVLIVSDLRMLRDFGLVTVFDLAVALIGVMAVLPAALVWAEGGFEPLAAWERRLRRRPSRAGESGAVP